MDSLYPRSGRGGIEPWDPRRSDESDEVGGEDRALSILRERYARGEIPLEEYERRVGPLVTHEACP